MQYSGILNIAHRGASGVRPENTMEAFRAAVDLGCDGIETDVQLSSDGVPVLIHDETLDRTTCAHGPVCGLPFAELSGLGIPSLVELLEFAREHGLILNLELKNSVVSYPGLEEKTIALVGEFGLAESVILSTFNHYSAVLCKELAPTIDVGLLYDVPLYRPARYCASVGANAIHPDFRTLSADIVAEAHACGIRINPYTINEIDDIESMIALGVDSIITNYPDRVRECLGKTIR
jgi:glycerophosphoryl diester phosphodiesterase